ncbi:MAG: hypothetical protein IJ287_00120 [Methanobrevibacter sp.]|nr:hypothetical protein [Methanobrevibacter sp.]
MKINYKLIGLVMFVMMICCISAASATDVDNITVPDDTGVIEIDDTVDSVDEVESEGIDDTVDGVDTQQNLRGNANINGNTNIANYFDSTTGVLLSNAGNTLTFGGDFYKANYNYKNFIVNRAVTINANATNIPILHDMGFQLIADGITLNGITFDINAPSGENCYAIDIESANNVNVINNKITYTCGSDNAAYYNYVIKANNSGNLTISGNKMNATLPLKTPDWYAAGINADFVAGVAIQDCDNLSFTGNTVNITGNRRVGGFPTLDAIMIVSSDDVYMGNNEVYLADAITATDDYSYIYGIDVYQCNRIEINNNTVEMNGNKSGGQYKGNGTGAAYCIQLTGPHTGIVISNNTLTTKNNGPNLGIYSQNYYGDTSITICGNHINVTGKAGSDEWSLVSGMELQDTNANVYGNTIYVNNTAGYNSTYYAFGISYCQNTYNDPHYYNIHDNNVTVYNADYAVYLLDDESVSGKVINNTLIAYNTGSNTGDNAVCVDENNVGVDNNN